MAPIAKDPEISSQPSTARLQPAAVEIPVTVNGARTVHGTDKREPFSENTQTVLVFANGAVVRLSSAVAPGQLLFLTNEKSKKEVVCQVVKSKNDRNVSGYVELEFTEAAPGFWGMRFPGTTAPPAGSGVGKPPVSTPSMKFLAEKLAEVKVIAPIAPASAPKPAENAVAAISAPTAVPAKPVKDLNTAPVVPAQPPAANASRIPSLSEFLTQGANGSELKAPEKPKPNQVPESANQSGANSRAVLPKLVPDSEKHDLAARLNLPPAPAIPNPAPGTSTFDFAAEEVKIPAWLEPLARNSATITEFKAPELKVAEPISFAAKPNEIPETTAVESEAKAPDPLNSATGAFESLEQPAAALTLSSEGPTPNFGSSLALDARSNSSESSSRSGKGLIFGLLATGLLLAAGGGWYWYSNQPTNVSANGNASSGQSNFGVSAPAGTAAAAPSSPSEPANPITTNAETLSFANRNSASPASSPVNNSVPAAGSNSQRSAAPAENLLPRSQPVAEPLPAAVKKPSVGEIHLAAPVVNRNITNEKETSGPIDLAPSFSGSAISTEESGGLNVLASKTRQPVAPVPVGGDVKQARLLSSVPPLYPTLARNQRLSGNVVIDALIDTNGRVSTMKVLSGPALLHQSAMEAVRQWKYQPATLNGQPMAMHLTVTVQFKLQ
jgi:TonB family protein